MDAGQMMKPRSCEHCLHFRPDELSTGFCQWHEMFVLKDFDCAKFEQCQRTAEGGEAQPERIVPVKECD
jgi:hypothetical protein